MPPATRATRRLLIAAPCFATGTGLVVYILSGMSLPLAVLLVAIGGVAVAVRGWRQTPVPVLSRLRRTAEAGLIAGVLATAAYDASRVLLVQVSDFAFRPFHTFTLFGQALLGTEGRGPWVMAVGTGFHLANGIGFAIAYTILCGRRGVVAGVAWAFALELAMVSVYPGWLGLKALDEFLRVSVVGHLAYGSVLGLAAQRLLQRGEDASHA